MGLLDPIFGSGEAPDYTGQEIGAAQQKDFYTGQDNTAITKNKVIGDVAQDLQLGKDPQNFSEQAIQNRARQKYGSFLTGLNNKTEFNVMEQSQQERAQYYDFARKIDLLNQHVREQREAAEQNQIAARNRVVGNILGVGGAVGGAFAAGPMGAYLGSKAGALAGNQTMRTAAAYRPQGYGISEQNSNSRNNLGAYNEY